MCITFDIGVFKAKFSRNFPFLPVYNVLTIYKKDDIVYDSNTDSFYKSLKSQNSEPLSDETAWQLTTEENVEDYVCDTDINNAKAEAEEVANEDILTELSFMYLVAFYLCYDLDLALSGASGQNAFAVSSKKVGSVSETYTVPKWIEDDPYLSFYARNGFGMKYLSLIRGKIIGNVSVVAGTTTPC